MRKHLFLSLFLRSVLRSLPYQVLGLLANACLVILRGFARGVFTSTAFIWQLLRYTDRDLHRLKPVISFDYTPKKHRVVVNFFEELDCPCIVKNRAIFLAKLRPVPYRSLQCRCYAGHFKLSLMLSHIFPLAFARLRLSTYLASALGYLKLYAELLGR